MPSSEKFTAVVIMVCLCLIVADVAYEEKSSQLKYMTFRVHTMC